MARYTNTLRDQNGAPVAGAYVTVLAPDGTAATLTDDNGDAMANPFVTDYYGGYTYNVASSGLYTNGFTFGGRLVFREAVPVGLELFNDQIIALADIADEVVTVAARDADIGTVAARDTDIGTVAARDTDIGTVADRDADIGTVADRDTAIGVVAARDTDIGTVAARDADIGLVADRDADIGTLAPLSSDIEALGSVAGNIMTLASIMATAGLYANEATGRAAVSNGTIFQAVGTTDETAIDVWRRDSSLASTLLRTYPSYLYVQAYANQDMGGVDYSTDTGMVPIVSDNAGQTVVGYDQRPQAIVTGKPLFAYKEQDYETRTSAAFTLADVNHVLAGSQSVSVGDSVPGRVTATPEYSGNVLMFGGGSFVGDIGSGSSTITITAVTNGTVRAGASVRHLTAIPAATFIAPFGTGGTTGVGGTGTYTLWNASGVAANATATVSGAVIDVGGVHPDAQLLTTGSNAVASPAAFTAFDNLAEATTPSSRNLNEGGESPISGVAYGLYRRLATNGNYQASAAPKVLGSSWGVGSNTAAQFAKANTSRQLYNRRFLNHLSSGKAIAAAAGQSYRVIANFWVGGEADVDTSLSSSTQYRGALFEGSVAGTQLTVTRFVKGQAIAVGQPFWCPGGQSSMTITALGTGTGGVGTYTISANLAAGIAAGSKMGTGYAGVARQNGMDQSADSLAINGAYFTASISGSVMTVTAVASGTLAVGQYLFDIYSGQFADGVTISSLGTGSGGTGTYNLSQSLSTVTSRPLITSTNAERPLFLITQNSYKSALKTGNGGSIAVLAVNDVADGEHFFIVQPSYQHDYDPADGIHPMPYEQRIAGEIAARVIDLVGMKRKKWTGLRIKGAWTRGTVCYVEFDVPAGPLAIDTTKFGKVQNYGFKVTDGVTTPNITDAWVHSPTVLALQMDASLAVQADAVLSYAIDYQRPATLYAPLTGCGAGNIRDSATGSIDIDGVRRFLWNWALHAQVPVLIGASEI